MRTLERTETSGQSNGVSGDGQTTPRYESALGPIKESRFQKGARNTRQTDLGPEVAGLSSDQNQRKGILSLQLLQSFNVPVLLFHPFLESPARGNISTDLPPFPLYLFAELLHVSRASKLRRNSGNNDCVVFLD